VGLRGNEVLRTLGAMAGALALSVSYAALSVAAQADVLDEAAGETVVVTGRLAVDTPPEQIKRQRLGIVDSISSTLIEKTADVTLPEALDRVVGVSSDKFYGTSDAGYVSIRGFDSRYNSMDVDGNPIWFSSQNNRGAQMGLLPSAIVKETSVYKTVTPDQDGNSIGGHISMRTLRAFDGGTAPYLNLAASLGSYDQKSRIAKGPSGRLSGAGKMTFGGDSEYGLVAGFSLQRLRGSDIYGGVDSYTQTNGADWANGNLYNNSRYDRDTENAAFYAKLEMRQTDRLYAFVSGTFFDERKKQYLQRAATYIYSTSGRTTNYANGAADFTGGQGQTKEYDYDIARQATVLGTGVDYRVSDEAVVTVRGNYTDYSNDILTRYPDAFILTGLSGHYDLNGDVPVITPASDAIYNNAAAWKYRNTSASYNRYQSLKDKVYSLKTDFSYNSFAEAQGFGGSIGTSWVRLDRGYDDNKNNYRLATGTSLYLTDIASAGATMANNDAIKFNWNSFWQYVYKNGILSTDASATADYTLTEDIAAANVSATYAWQDLHLLAGLRYEHTADDIGTADTVSNVVTPVKRSHSYDNLMPNVQVRYDISPALRVQVAYTKTIGRADFADFAPGRTSSLDSNGLPVISGTNPNLDPRDSSNYDLSVEYYLSNGLVSLALFHKDIAHETFSQRSQVFDSNGALLLTQTVPLNSGSAAVTGLEAAVVINRLSFLPAPLDGLGINANFTYLDGTWHVVFSDSTTRNVGGLRNQPEWMGNLILTYDLDPIDLSVAYRPRGRTFTGTFGTTSVGDIWIEGTGQVDATAGWKFGHNLSLKLEARNLTDVYTRQVTGAADSVYNSVGGGRSYFVGLRYRF